MEEAKEGGREKTDGGWHFEGRENGEFVRDVRIEVCVV